MEPVAKTEGNHSGYSSEDDATFVNDDQLTVEVDMNGANYILGDDGLDYNPFSKPVLNMKEHISTPSQFSHPAYEAVHEQLQNASGGARSVFRKILSEDEKEFWWRMYEPKSDTVEQVYVKGLKPRNMTRSVSTNTLRSESKSNRQLSRELRDEKWLARKQSESDLDKRNKPKGQGVKRKIDFFEDLAQIDCSVYAANLKTYTTDGNLLSHFNFKAMCDGLRKVRSVRDGRNCYWSSKRVADSLGYKCKPQEDLVELDDVPWMIKDADGVVGVINLPRSLGSRILGQLNGSFRELFQSVKLSTCQAEAKGRGSGYLNTIGRIIGCVNMAYAWVPLGVKNTAARASLGIINGGQSASLTKSAVAFANIQKHLKESRNLSTIVNYTLYRSHLTCFWAYVKASSALRELIPAAKAVATHDPSLSSGKSVIANRSTRLHFDNKEAPEGWAVLVVLGDCTTGMLSLPRLGIKFKYVAGSVVLLRGRLIDHEVIDWDGKEDRICVAYFNHVTEWEKVGVVPPL